MLLTLLAVQAATLDADSSRAALACAHAVVENGGTPGNALRFTSQYYYFLMASAIASPGPASVAARTLAACDVRYPMARKTGLATLPDDRFKRDALCAAALGMGVGGVVGASGADTFEEGKLRTVLDAYVGRLSDVRLAMEGYAGDGKVDALFATALETSMATGNLDMVVAACAREMGQ